MTEYQAWRYLEMKWREARPNVFGRYEIWNGIEACDGLCCSADQLFYNRTITTEIRSAMRLKIPKAEIISKSHPYLWSRTTKRGALARAKFCKKQADKLKAKK